MSRHVAVIGAGVAGTAAAYAATLGGARVTVVVGRPGATSLGSGAIDGATARAFGDDRTRVVSFFDALGLWEIGPERCRVATRAGVLREARGRDRAVLDLSRAPPGAVAVVDDGRTNFDAQSLARAWTADAWAKERGLVFEPIRVDLFRLADDRWLPDADLAERHDQPDRVGWLVECLRGSRDLKGKGAIVLGPWLGLRTNVAGELTRELGIEVGETLSIPGGVAGMRFEHARDQLYARSGIERVAGWATAVRASHVAGGHRVELGSDQLEADAIVLAVGGLTGGGIAWSQQASHGFVLSLEAPVSFALRSRRLEPSGSPSGPLFEPFAWSGQTSACGFERVGVWTDADGRVRDGEGSALDWLYAAGDAAADAPRTALEAIRSGVAAGTLAAGR